MFPGDEKGRPELVRCLVYYGLLGLVLLAAFWPFADVLGYYFTKTDTGPLLFSARVEAPGDVVRILTSSVTGSLYPKSIYYRPVTTFSFSLDWALWGLNPFGYHLTDLLLHVSVAGLLYRVVYLFNGRDVWSAELAGAFYTLHPVLVEVVPAVAHRQETLVAVFLLTGLWAFWRYEYDAGGGATLSVALSCFVLSSGAKETGLIFLPLVMAHLWITNPDERPLLRQRLTAVLRRGLPYLTTAAGYLLWWSYVTNLRAFQGGKSFRPPLYRGSWWNYASRHLTNVPQKVFTGYFRALFYPLRDVVYDLGLPVEELLNPLAVLPGASTTIIVIGVGLIFVALTVRYGRWSKSRNPGNAGSPDNLITSSFLFYTVWLLLPALFYTATNIISYKHAYHGVIPLSALLGTLLMSGGHRTLRTITDRAAAGGGRLTGGLALLMSVGIFAVLLWRVSPLRIDYPAWDHTQEVNRIYHDVLFHQISDLPVGSTINLPTSPFRSDSIQDFPHNPQGLLPKFWIHMKLPDRQFHVRRLGLKPVNEPCPCALWLERERLGPRTFAFMTHLHQHDQLSSVGDPRSR